MPTSPAPVIALTGPRPAAEGLLAALGAAGGVGVQLPATAGAGADALLGCALAALACDALVVVLPAEVGLDPGAAWVWQEAADAALPRMVLIEGLGPDTADFEDLAAIAERVLGPECLPARLPVLDDDEHVTASMGLASLTIDTEGGSRPAEPEHVALTAELREVLVTEVAVVSTDDGFAEGVLAGISPSPDRLAGEVARAVARGLVAPVLAASPEGAWARDLVGWVTGADEETQIEQDRALRLALRDAHGEPGEGAAAMVVAAGPSWLLVRPVFGSLPTGAAHINGPCIGAAGLAAPARAWPVHVEGAGVQTGGLVRVESPVRADVGDTLATGHLWLLPAEHL